jgi:hypothetical protein
MLLIFQMGCIVPALQREATMLKLLIGAACVVAIAASSGYWWYRHNNPPMLLACEAALKQKLVSPSGYRRVETTHSYQRLDRRTFEKLENSSGYPASVIKADLMDFDRGNLEPTIFHIFISYDAPNAYGVSLRGNADCSHFSVSGAKDNATKFNVALDGKNFIR